MRLRFLLVGAAAALAVLLTGYLAQAQDNRRRKIESYYSPRGGVSEATVKEIDSASKSIDVAMYSISTGSTAPIFMALKRAVERGVKVRCIFNKARTGSSNKRKSLALEGIGVDVRYVTKTMHHKFAVIDGKILLTGSANWSTSADLKHSENMQLIVRPKYVVTAFKREYRLLQSLSKDFDPQEFQP